MTLHCGACNTEFDNESKLTAHLESCSAVKAILLPVTALMYGSDDQAHFAAHLIRQLPRAKHHIVEYARMIATDTGSWERSVVHQRMCDNLGLDYSTFRPFESAEITKIPSQKEAEDIIYNAIGDVLRKHMFT